MPAGSGAPSAIRGPGPCGLHLVGVGRDRQPGTGQYSAAKGGIVALVKTAARELARPQTTVNAIRPGFIDTAMTREMPDAARAALIDSIPLGRVGQPEDVAGAVAFLVSDDAAFITGATIDVNGGFYM